MAFIDWSKPFGVGVPCIDDEHKVLIELVNDIHRHLHSCASDADLKRSFHELSTYTATHFSNEERLFVGTEYPRAAFHARQHGFLLQILGCFEKGMDKSGRFITFADQLNFLRCWLMDHIFREDKRLGDFLNNREPEVSQRSASRSRSFTASPTRT